MTQDPDRARKAWGAMTPQERDELKRIREEELRTITAMLQDRVESLAPVLLPDGRRDGIDWREGRRGSRSIRLSGTYRGVFRDFESGEKGCDMLQAIADLLCNGNLRDAIAWARSWLGLSDMSEDTIALAKKRAEERRASAEADRKKHNAKRIRQARGLWFSAAPIVGTPAAAWLMARGIDIAELAAPPAALRYNPETWCSERKRPAPAMVSALFRSGEAQLVATHRTYIEELEPGRWGKAPVQKVRSILGSWPGAVIPLQRGKTGRRWVDMDEGETVAFGEGIEEGLSIALVRPEWRVGAVGFVGNFGQIKLPKWAHVILCINNDPPGSEAERAVFGDPEKNRPGAVRELEGAGHVVRVVRPPAGFKDWNDLLNGKRQP